MMQVTQPGGEETGASSICLSQATELLRRQVLGAKAETGSSFFPVPFSAQQRKGRGRKTHKED